MNLFDILKKRRSIRHFSDIPVEWGKIVQILEAGSLAPSSGNVQNWRFIIVTDKNVKQELADACLEQEWMTEAPIFIIVLSDNVMIEKLYSRRGKEFYAVQNCAAAIENMLLMTEQLGLGACWVGAFEEEAVKRILDIPQFASVQAILPIGYPAEEPPEPMHYSLETTCYFGKYGNKIKDIDAVLWNFNIVGNTIKITKNALNRIKKHVNKRIKTLKQTKE